MVLRKNNFEITTRFSFRPFEGRQWELRTARLLEWRTEKVWVMTSYTSELRLRLELELDEKSTEVDFRLGGIGISSVLGLKSEPRRNSPDLAERSFPVFICKPPSWNPGDRTKNAWVMRDELLNPTDSGESPQFQGLLRFLNRWGAFYGQSFRISDPSFQHLTPFAQQRHPYFGYSFTFPHLLLQKREEYRQAILPENARKWLYKSDPLYPVKINEPPYYLVEHSDCMGAIEATITIDHLANRRFGFCDRCGKLFEREYEHKKSYCSRPCIKAADAKRRRDRKREEAKGNAAT